jgi:hydroxymethylbilane synthase
LKLRLGTRGSALALAQAELVGNALAANGLEVEIVPITTSGDQRPDGAAAAPDDKSRFVKEIEDALLREEVNLAVHSAKDVPSELPEGLSIVGVPERADPRDTLCGADSIAGLSIGAKVGTSSLRRRSQLLAARPDLEIRELRGNVDTRMSRLAKGDFEAVVVAAAGLARLGRAAEGVPLSEHDLIPAPGQGCLALEARTEDEPVAEVAAALTDRGALLELTAERGLVGALEASCRTPVGGRARLADGELRLSAFVGLPDGSAWVRDSLDGDPADPGALGAAVAERLLTAGAGKLLAAAEGAAA